MKNINNIALQLKLHFLNINIFVIRFTTKNKVVFHKFIIDSFPQFIIFHYLSCYTLFLKLLYLIILYLI